MNARNRSYRLTTIFAITLLMSGCVVPMYPKSDPTKLLGELRNVDRTSLETELKDCRSEETRECRNTVVQKLMAYVDQGFLTFKARLQGEDRERKLWSGWARLGLSTATSVVTGVRSKENLGTASTLLQGGEPILDEHVLQGQAIHAIIRQMDSGRATERGRIFRGLLQNEKQYPLSAALNDVTRYYYAGSLPAALSSIRGAAEVGAVIAEVTATGIKLQFLDSLQKEHGASATMTKEGE